MNFEQIILADIRNLLREILEVAKTLKMSVPPMAPEAKGGPVDADNPYTDANVDRPTYDQDFANKKTIKRKGTK